MYSFLQDKLNTSFLQQAKPDHAGAYKETDILNVLK